MCVGPCGTGDMVNEVFDVRNTDAGPLTLGKGDFT